MRQQRVREQGGGFVFLVALFTLTGLVGLTAVGLTRSMTELLAANRYVVSQQAFQLAEAGIDEAVAEFTVGGASGFPTDGWTPETTSCPAGKTCWQKTVSYSTASVQREAVTVIDATSRFPTIIATGISGRAGDAITIPRSLQVTIQLLQKLPVLGAVTVVGEDTKANGMLDISFGTHSAATTFEGCDRSSDICLPASTTLTQQAYDGTTDVTSLKGAINTFDSRIGYFGPRMHGALSDLSTPDPHLPDGRYIVPGDYSIHKATTAEKGILSFDLLNNLASWAQSQARTNGCARSSPNYTGSLDSVSPYNVPVRPGELGTDDSPKVCYVEYRSTYPDGRSNRPYTHPDIRFPDGTTGAGVLVVRGELEIPPGATFKYNGILVIVGPSTELAIGGTAEINGTVFIGTTEPTCKTFSGGVCTELQWSPQFFPEYDLEGDGTVQYDSQWVANGLEKLSRWTPPGWTAQGNDKAVIKLWVETPPQKILKNNKNNNKNKKKKH